MSTGSGACLLNHKPLPAGVVVEFYTYAVQTCVPSFNETFNSEYTKVTFDDQKVMNVLFPSRHPIVFQIWRPEPSVGEDVFRLAGQFDYIPSKKGFAQVNVAQNEPLHTFLFRYAHESRQQATETKGLSQMGETTVSAAVCFQATRIHVL